MTFRAFLIGLCLVAAFSSVVAYADLYLQGSKLAFNHLPISALASAVVTRAGALRLYRWLRLMFIGFVLGEFVTAALWIPIDAVMGVRGHIIFPRE